MSEIRIGATVSGGRGSIGHLHQVVLDVTTNRITHLVVAPGLVHDHRAVPATALVGASYDQLRLDLEDLDDLPTVDLRRRDLVVRPGEQPGLDGGPGDGDVPRIVLGAELPVLDADGEQVGHVDEWFSDGADPALLTHAVVERSGGIRLDHWIVVPVGHFHVGPEPVLHLALTGVDLDALAHHPALPGTHLSSQDHVDLDLSAWTPRDPDEITFGEKGPPGSSRLGDEATPDA